MGHEVLSLVKGVGRAIFSYPYKTQPAEIIAKMLTNLLCEKIQRLTGRTSIRAWNPLLTFFFGSNEHVL